MVIVSQPAISFSQNFNGGSEDGYSVSFGVNYNLNSVPEYFSVEITLADGQLSLSNASIINFKATFNKNTNNFSAADVIVGGTANPSSTSVVTGGPLVYNIAVSGMANNGTVNATIPAGVCNDNIIGSQNAASINQQNEVDYDNQKPGIEIIQTIGQLDTTNISPINFTATFTEPVTGFDQTDITLGGTASPTTAVISGTGPAYNIAVSGMTGEGTVSISISADVCTDLAGNTNTSFINTDNTVFYDNSKPGVTIAQAIGQTNPTGNSPINFAVSFSEPVTGFDESDVTIEGTAGATTVVVSGNGSEYNIAVSGMTQNGTVIISIPSDACNDLAGNLSLESFASQVEFVVEEITKFEANNIFAPNSNFNRYWIIKDVNLYSNYELIILNSSGQKIYQAVNYQNDWNGTYKNKALPTGTYFYSFSSPDKRTVYKGFINIIYE